MRSYKAQRSMYLVMAVAAFILIAPAALANHKPEADPMENGDISGKPCKGLKHGVQKKKIWFAPSKGNTKVSQKGGGIFCGSDFSDKAKPKGFSEGKITLPKGVKVRCMNPLYPNACTGQSDIAEKTYIGKVVVSTVSIFNEGTATPFADIESVTYVGTAPGMSKNEDCTADAVACYQGRDTLSGIDGPANFYGNMVVKPKPGQTDRLQLTIKPIKVNPNGPFAGLIKTNYFLSIGSNQDDDKTLNLCTYAADSVGKNECGTNPNNWLHESGKSGQYVCNSIQLFIPEQNAVGIGWIFDVTSNIDANKPASKWEMVKYSPLSKYSVKNCVPMTLS